MVDYCKKSAMLKHILYGVGLLLLSNSAVVAQVAVEEDGNSITDTTGVVLYADARFETLSYKHTEVKKGVIRSGQGYRVQIYQGPDRAKANETRLEFMKKYPNIRSYLTYSSPIYKVKIGDFVDKEAAVKLMNILRHTFSPTAVVRDIVEINTLRND
jgi:hypothetical protein